MPTTLIESGNIRTEDDHWAIIDARFYLPEPDRGEADYLEAHIPGALYAHLDRDLSGPITGQNGRHPLPSLEHMVERFSTWGIDDEVQVVVYDTAGGQIAARLWWMLRYLGHDRVAVLDGGLRAYDSELRSGREERASRTFTPRIENAFRVDLETLLPRLDETLLIDARAGERFRGETEPLDPVAGHIPGARNVPSSTNLDDSGRFLHKKVLHERYQTVVGGASAEEVVCYCGSGVTACHDLLAMEIAGIHGARLYPGSWSEWCADPNRPVETG